MTIAELEKRWKNVLSVTRTAVVRHPGAYLELKSLAADIVESPIDITEYIPTAEKLAGLLKIMDPEGRGSIFYLFNDRIAPCSIQQVPLLRVECKDLLDHLRAFDAWQLKTRRLKLVK